VGVGGKNRLGIIQKYKQKIFNDYSSFGLEYFFDHSGRKIWYEFEEDSSSPLYLFYKGKCIGKMLFGLQDDYIEIWDILVFDRHTNFRNCGIGSWMFTKLKEIAISHNLKSIKGKMVPEQSGDWPKLINFYKKQGCLVEDGCFVFNF
jgi:hypothetical protein